MGSGEEIGEDRFAIFVCRLERLVMRFKHHIPLISYGMEDVEELLPIYISVTREKMLVGVCAVVVLNVQGDGSILALE